MEFFKKTIPLKKMQSIEAVALKDNMISNIVDIYGEKNTENVENLNIVSGVAVTGEYDTLIFFVKAILTLAFPPLMLLWIFLMIKNRNNNDKSLYLEFQNKSGDMAVRQYIFKKCNPEIIDNKIEEIREFVNKNPSKNQRIKFNKLALLKFKSLGESKYKNIG